MAYKLFRGFKKIGEYRSISEAKKMAPYNQDGIYNLVSSDKTYRDSWQIVNGKLYNEGLQ